MRTSPEVLGRQGFGAMRLGETAGHEPDTDPHRVINTALDLGVTMVDTADAYQNEELVGRIIRPRRDEVFLASKFGLVWLNGIAGDYEIRADPAYVQQACEASLDRLRVEAIDLYYLHHRSDRVPIEETVGAMAGLIDQGKVRYLGLSNVTADDLRRADAVHPIVAAQEEWSLVQRGIEAEFVAAAERVGTVLVAHSPMGHGVVHSIPEQGAADTQATLQSVAAAHDATPGQVALAWVHQRNRAHDAQVVPLPGTTRVSHVRENVAAADLALTDAELRRLTPTTDAGAGITIE